MPSASGGSGLMSWKACEPAWRRGWRCTISVSGSTSNLVVLGWLSLICWSGDLNSHQAFKRDGLLYTRCQIRLIILHHEDHMWFIDCHHVSDEMVSEILRALKVRGRSSTMPSLTCPGSTGFMVSCWIKIWMTP